MSVKSGHRRPLKRREARCQARPHHAWDIETTNIDAGTPEPRYVSLADSVEQVDGWPCIGRQAFHDVLVERFLIDKYCGHRFVAHNANRFDNYQLVLALLDDPRWFIEPWLTRAQDMRGLAVYDAAHPKRAWYFSDSMAMLAFAGTLDDLVRLYAPHYAKTHSVDWSTTVFDPVNIEHVAYALNDSRILQAALDKAGEVVGNLIGLPLQNTIGKLGILFWQKSMPPDVNVWTAPPDCLTLLHKALRGGLVYCRGAFRGQAWQYDINQSYTHQQRRPLPCGRCLQTWGYLPGKLGIYEVELRRLHGVSLPFYCLDLSTNKMVQTDAATPVQTVILSPELDLLQSLGWQVEVKHGYVWSDAFDMHDMAQQLETARATCDGGPKGPIGMMIKAIGNNAFGKTLEETDGIRYRFSAERPGKEYREYESETPEARGLWFTIEDSYPADWHKMQIGCFIMAYGRIQLYEQLAKHGDAVLYTDTDCLITRKDISTELDVHLSRYGAWKVEHAASEVILLNKKVYAWPQVLPPVTHWKGLHVAQISLQAYETAYTTGVVPEQSQLQRRGIIRVLCGMSMFGELSRHGSAVLQREAG